MIMLMRVLTICAILLALACSAPAQQQAPAVPSASDVAARIGDRAITVKELDDQWRQAQPAEQAQAIQQLYDGRKQALDVMVAEMLVEQAAKARGMDSKLFTDTEVASRTKPVTDGQVAAFFQENQSQMQGRGIDAMGPVIRSYLEDQQKATAYQTWVAELRKAGPPVRMALDAPRYTVDVAPGDPTLGTAIAPVTLIEFSDFECPFCARVMPTLKRVHEVYGDRVRIVWKDFPLTSIHPRAFTAAAAGQCAQEQGKFWEYHDRLFANQQALQPDALKQHAVATGLDAAKFNDCLDTAKHGVRVQEQIGVGTNLGIRSTPAVFINGRLVSGAHPFEVFAGIIDEELERAKTR